MTIQEPTIGRVVYLYDLQSSEKPFTGYVADVGVGGNPFTINCAALTHSGDFILGGLQGVPHRSEPLDHRIVWDWMPFQKGQAAKNEEVAGSFAEIKRMAAAGKPLI